MVIEADREAYEATKFARRRTVDLDGLAVAVITPEDLILSKLVRGRDATSSRQAEDVRLLLQDLEDLDDVYLRHWAAALHLSETLVDLRPDA